MNASRGNYTGVSANEEKQSRQEEKIDPDSERKIRSAADGFIHRLERVRPRIAMAFRKMQIDSNKITVEVPNESLREEILRYRSEILTLLVEVAALSGSAELEVNVIEEIADLKPIRVEDRLKFLTEKNPLLTSLKKKMDLDME